MEEVFTRPAKTKDAGIFIRQVGRGRVVYFPWDVDRTFWEVLNADHGKLLRNAVVWATNEPAPVTVEGKGMVDISVWTQKSSMTVHLVNLTNPMMMKGPVREFIPLPPQRVAIRLPLGRRPRAVKLLANGQAVRFTEAGGEVRLTVPSILDHEVIAVDL